MNALETFLPMRRREALKVLAASVSAVMAGCGKPREEIVPQVQRDARQTPGLPLYFATSVALDGYGRGVIATSYDGRPTKLEGNPRHPASLGATDVFAEAELMQLYDPERSRTPRQGSRIASWDALFTQLAAARRGLEATQGAGLRILSGRITSPTLLRQLASLQARYPRMRWHRYAAIDDDAARAGSRLAFGRVFDTLPRIERADVILTLGADPLGPGPAQIRNARAFAQAHTLRKGEQRLQRWYAAESVMSASGACADHRIALAPAALRAMAARLASALGIATADAGDLETAATGFAQVAAEDLLAHRGRALILVGREQPPELHALVHRLNQVLAAPDATLDYIDPVDPHPDDSAASLAQLAAELAAGQVELLAVLGANPVYDTPAGLRFAEAIAHARLSLHLGLHRDETALACHWHLPQSHALETWGDVRAVDGTASVIQPLIAPLYDSRSTQQVLACFAGDFGADDYRIVRETWRADFGESAFETRWQRALHQGCVEGSAAAVVVAPEARASVSKFAIATSAGTPSHSFAVIFAPDVTLWDGSFANNAWLQECPKPFTGEVWGAAAQLAPADAAALDLTDGDVVKISVGDRTLEIPVAVVAGTARGCVRLALGHGRRRVGAIGEGIGVDVQRLRPADGGWQLPDATLARTNRRAPLLVPQLQQRIEGDTEKLFPLLRPATLAAFAPADGAPQESLYPELPPRTVGSDYAWAMVIDTTRCIGCKACVVACQAENNVPIVGPEEIAAGRDLHWLRVDSRLQGASDAPRHGFQPVPCMQCEHAPCEPVCPVEASVHDREGLNVQVYNRCIGTRFCSANCPYKVRRFNFFDYADRQAYKTQGAPIVWAQRNPEVTVRQRGVMEKCTYCVQRISGARRAAEKDNRRIEEGEVRTACQSACPTSAIDFGDLDSTGSPIALLRREPQHYALLAELRTRPRTTYLAQVRNPHPELPESRA